MPRDEMIPPFFVVDGDDIMFCRSIADLESFIEPIDAPNTTAYDARGYVVRLEAVRSNVQGGSLRSRLRSGLLVTRAVATGDRDEAALEASLRHYFARVDPNVTGASLADFLAHLERYGIHYS